MIEITRIQTGSAFKIGFIVSGVLWTLVAILIILFPSAFIDSRLVMESGRLVQQPNQNAFLVALCGWPIYAIAGGISFAVTALAYNWVADSFGGLMIEISDMRREWRELQRERSQGDQPSTWYR